MRETTVTVTAVDKPVRFVWGGIGAPPGKQFVYIAEGKSLVAGYRIAERLRKDPGRYVLRVKTPFFYGQYEEIIEIIGKV